MKIAKFIQQQYQSFSRPVQVFFQSWLYIVLMLISILVYGCLQQLLSVVMRACWHSTNSLFVVALVSLALLVLIYCCITALMNKNQYSRAVSNIKSKRLWLETFGWLITVKLFQLFLAWITSNHINTSNQNAINHIFYSGSVNQMYIILTGILMAPLVEEFIFRWLAFRFIKAQSLALILGTIAFVMLHCPNSIISFVIYLSMAIALEINFYCNGYWGSYALHFLINFTAVLAML